MHHSKRIIEKGFNLLLITLASTMLIVMLYGIADKINHQPNGFYRLFPPHVIRQAHTIDLKNMNFYIAGAGGSQVYLGYFNDPFHLLTADFTLTDTQRIGIKYSRSLRMQRGTIQVDSPFFCVTDWNTKTILAGTLSDPIAKDWAANHRSFVDAIPLSPSSFILRTLNDSSTGYLLAKESFSEPTIQIASTILERQSDGFFSTDGMIVYDPTSTRIVYLYYYRNQFMVMDSNLHLIYRLKTIDTTTLAKVKTGIIPAEHALTLTSPPVLINLHVAAYGHWLLIHSGLLSDNEDPKLFAESSVIDVYDLTKQSYRFSFYVFHDRGKKISGIRLVRNQLIVLDDQYLSVYTLDPKLMNF